VHRIKQHPGQHRKIAGAICGTQLCDLARHGLALADRLRQIGRLDAGIERGELVAPRLQVLDRDPELAGAFGERDVGSGGQAALSMPRIATHRRASPRSGRRACGVPPGSG
jgi:hypothetical protein